MLVERVLWECTLRDRTDLGLGTSQSTWKIFLAASNHGRAASVFTDNLNPRYDSGRFNPFSPKQAPAFLYQGRSPGCPVYHPSRLLHLAPVLIRFQLLLRAVLVKRGSDGSRKNVLGCWKFAD